MFSLNTIALSRGLYRSFISKPEKIHSLTLFFKQSIPTFPTSTLFKRRFATFIPNIPTENFFHRPRESAALEKILEGDSKISVLTGPVDAGKTSLLLSLLNKSQNERPVLYLDMLRFSFQSINYLNHILELFLNIWLSELDIPKKVQLAPEEWGSPAERLNFMLIQVEDHLSLKGEKRPIVFVDRAEKLQHIAHESNNNGQINTALSIFLDWFLVNSKQKNHFHVILGTNHSTFVSHLESYLGSSNFSTYLIGHLSKEEAQLFWNSLIEKNKEELKTMPPPPFEEAYQVCGGCIYHLQSYFNDYYRLDCRLTPESFWLYRQQRLKLANLFFQGTMDSQKHTDRWYEKKWSRDQFLTLLRNLVDSKEGFLPYEEICSDLGIEFIEQMIKKDLLFLRPTNQFAYDVNNVPLGKAIVTADTPATQMAMKCFLKTLNNGVIK